MRTRSFLCENCIHAVPRLGGKMAFLTSPDFYIGMTAAGAVIWSFIRPRAYICRNKNGGLEVIKEL